VLGPNLRSAALCALALMGQSEAATYDPELTWRTLTTRHFHIHFHQGLEELADELSAEIDAIHDQLTTEIGWRPRRRTHVVLIDRTDQANGWAAAVPYNHITIFVTSPTNDGTLAHFESWTPAIQTHEYTHTLHIDTNHGIVRVARWIVGRVASTNRLSPSWVVEGFATFQETRQTNAGRGRTPLVSMMLRTAALEDDLPGLGRLDGHQAAMPAGQLRYLFGQDFMRHVADTQGEQVWTRFIHRYGGGLPYLLPGRGALGRRLGPLHTSWLASVRERADAEVQRAALDGPITRGEPLTPTSASCAAPTYAPDGASLVWSCLDIALGSQIWIAGPDGDDARVLLQDRGARSFSWRPDSKAFTYAGLHVVNRFNVWSDVYLHTIGQPGAVALTQGARASDPELSPDGARLLVVTNRAQRNQLEVLTVDRRRVPLAAFEERTQIATPRYSPDGRAIAAVLWRDGRWDLWMLDADGQPRRRLTHDAAVEREPRWSADGALLYFASDRTGIPNVFALAVATEELWQVTNTATGAVAPSPHPDGERLAWQEYHAHGWAIVVDRIDRERWIPHGRLPPSPRFDAPVAALTTPQAPPPRPADAPDFPAAEGDGSPRRRGVPIDPVGDPPPGLDAARAPRASRLPDSAHRADPQQDPGGIDSFDQVDVRGVFGEEQDYPFRIAPRRYTPLGTLVPRYWTPFVQSTPFTPRKPFEGTGVGLVASASTGSTDPARHYAWSAGASYRTDAAFASGAASFTLNRWIPVYGVSVARSATTPSPLLLRSDTEIGPDGEPALTVGPRYWEARHGVAASINYPYTFRTWLFARYAWSHRAPLDAIPDDAVRERLPLRGALGAIQGGWRYAWSQPTRTAISVEDGRIVSIVGGVVHPWLGAYALSPTDERRPLSAVQLTADAREYVVMPWARNHVLAMRGGVGFAAGADSYLGLYQLGGSFGDGAFYVTPESSLMLRGYDIGAAVGDLYWLASAEYRLPLYRIDHGVGTLPAFARALAASAFIDAGQAYASPERARDLLVEPLVGVGAELSLSAVLWYGVGFRGRVGFATGLTGPGYRLTGPRGPDPRLVYARVGGTF
jgi:hypothetical protein